MALTNQQYDTITREYEEIQMQNRLLTDQKRAEIDAAIPGLKPLENRMATCAVMKTKYLLDDKADEAADMDEEIAEIVKKQDALLLSAGFSRKDLEPIYTCPDCKDTGYLLGGNIRKKCHCFRDREMVILYNQSGIRELLSTENFSKLNFEHLSAEEHKQLETAVSFCHSFVESFDADYRNLVFCGTVGTGKSYLSCCIAAELLSSYHSVLYLSSQHLFDVLSAIRFGRTEDKSSSSFAESLYDCDLLILDDLGTEMTNSFVASELFTCLNERHLRKRSTIISTNLDLMEIRDRYSERILSRLTGNYSFLRLTGPDRRQFQ